MCLDCVLHRLETPVGRPKEEKLPPLGNPRRADYIPYSSGTFDFIFHVESVGLWNMYCSPYLYADPCSEALHFGSNTENRRPDRRPLNGSKHAHRQAFPESPHKFSVNLLSSKARAIR